MTMSSNANSKIIIKPNPYDGKTPWDEYFTHFNVIADINGWNNSEKANILAAMLRDSVVNILQELTAGKSIELRKAYISTKTEIC